jgi:hypothetical protein
LFSASFARILDAPNAFLGGRAMAKRSRFANKAHRAFWSVHIEAWRQSGVSQRAYCSQHRLSSETFRRWRKAFDEADLVRAERVQKRRITWARRGGVVGSKALVAFWSMHVEALQWSGLSVRAYAGVHQLSPHCLSHWRRRLTERYLRPSFEVFFHAAPNSVLCGAPHKADYAELNIMRSGSV